MVDGIEIIKKAYELSIEDWDNVQEEIDPDPISGEEIATNISKFITTGSIYLSCSQSENNRCIGFESLEINSDGTGRERYFFAGVGDTPNFGEYTW